jgi:pilus assembly protein CpaC
MRFRQFVAGIAIAAALAIVSLPHHILAQTPLSPPSQQAASQQIVLDAGSGRLVSLPAPAATVISANPSVVRVQPTSPSTLFLVGVTAGHTSVIATADNGQAVAQFDVTVRGGAAPTTTLGGGAPVATPTVSTAQMESALRQAVPGLQGLRLTRGPTGVMVDGTVDEPAAAERVNTILQTFLGTDAKIVNDLNVRAAIQVNVRVRIAEIDRQITRELGFNWQALGAGNNWVFGLRTGLAAASTISPLLPLGAVLANAPAANSFGGGYVSSKWDVNGIIDALAADQLISILAEPNLTALSGQTASFLAGGEFPIPVAGNGTGNTVTISVDFKQYGISLAFVPTVIGADRINLKVRPEVSQLTTTGAVSVPIGNGGTLTIPALTVRRAETTVELGSGQSFAIAGLLQHNGTQANNSLPGIGELPVLGALFRSTSFQRDESELVIIVTPYIVKPTDAPRALATPMDNFKPATDLDRLLYGYQFAKGVAPVRNVPADTGFILE